jgi:hypothetical protein
VYIANLSTSNQPASKAAAQTASNATNPMARQLTSQPTSQQTQTKQSLQTCRSAWLASRHIGQL